MNSEIIIYLNPLGDIKIDVRLEEETVWLTQAQLCGLFQKSKATISEHIKNVFKEGELVTQATVRKFRTVQVEGSREVQREVDHYNHIYHTCHPEYPSFTSELRGGWRAKTQEQWFL